MARNVYAPTNDIKAAANIRGTIDDELILDTAEDVSREIDLECGRHFFEMTATKFWTAESADCCVVTDLLSVSNLRTDAGHNRDYSSTFNSTGFELAPFNATMQSPPQPYWRIETTPQSTNSFPMNRRGVRVTGSWGYFNVTKSGGTITAAADATSTGLVVSDGTKVQPGHTFKTSAGEQIYVNDVDGTTANVERAVNGTTAAAITSGSTFGIYTYPVIRRACVLQTARILARHEAALGVVGGGDVGQIRLTAELDPDVKRLLARFVLPVAL